MRAATEEGKAAGRIAVHVVGGSDIGLPDSGRGATGDAMSGQLARRLADARRWLGRSAGPYGGQNENGTDDPFAGTPVERFLNRLAVETEGHQETESVAVALLATTGPTRPTMPIAQVVREYAGWRLPHLDVSVEQLLEPTVASARAWTKDFLARTSPATTAWELPLGAGATGLLLGMMFELLVRAVPFALRTEDEEAALVQLTADASVDALRRWLVRHRFYDALAALDPTWEQLARRQAVDVEWLLTTATGHRPEDRTWRWTTAPAPSCSRRSRRRSRRASPGRRSPTARPPGPGSNGSRRRTPPRTVATTCWKCSAASRGSAAPSTRAS